MVFASPKEGFISGGQTGIHGETGLWWTSDGGNNWFPVALSARSGETLNWTFEPTFFNAEDRVMAVEVNTWELVTYATQNGGKTWSEGGLLLFSTQMGVVQIDGLRVYDGQCTRRHHGGETSDGGRSFNPVAAKSRATSGGQNIGRRRPRVAPASSLACAKH